MGADRKWMEDCIADRKVQTCAVQNIQRQLANQRCQEEQASLDRFYDDIRSRAHGRRGATMKDSQHALNAPIVTGFGDDNEAGYPPLQSSRNAHGSTKLLLEQH